MTHLVLHFWTFAVHSAVKIMAFSWAIRSRFCQVVTFYRYASWGKALTARSPTVSAKEIRRPSCDMQASLKSRNQKLAEEATFSQTSLREATISLEVSSNLCMTFAPELSLLKDCQYPGILS